MEESIFVFIFRSILLGVALAMDAFSVSIADGLKEINMKIRKEFFISFLFAFFQFLMPFLGWIGVHTLSEKFSIFKNLVPYIAFFLLLFLGIKMIIEGVKERKGSQDNNKIEEKNSKLTTLLLLTQAIATSIDALSVGFTLANYTISFALYSSLIIALVTFPLSFLGIKLGKLAGRKWSHITPFIGGTILILIGLEILIKSFFN